MLKSMTFVLKMDRIVDAEKHYISPGGYCFNGKQFDFEEIFGNILVQNEKKTDEVKFECYGWDKTYSASAADLTEEDLEKPEEFYISTGEYDDPEIYPVSIKDLEFEFEDGRVVEAGPETIQKINKLIEEDFRFAKE